MIDWNKEIKSAFPNAQKAPWITIPVNGSYEGVVRQVKFGITNKFGSEIVEVWFSEDGKDRHFDASEYTAPLFEMQNIQVGDHIKISLTETPAFDKANGTPIINADGSQKMYKNYAVEVVERGSSEGAPKAANPDDANEVDLKDIPF